MTVNARYCLSLWERAHAIAGSRPRLRLRDVKGIMHARLQVLGSFSLVINGHDIATSHSGERVFAALTVLGGRAHRSHIAGLLWADQTEERALSNLRATMWRMPAVSRDLIARRGAALVVSHDVTSDHHDSTKLARCLLDGHIGSDRVDRSLLTHDVLPAFDEEWLVVPRERHRQLRLHALEAFARLDLDRRRPLDAVDTALVAVDAEPLRESSQILLVRAHLAAGNRAAAVDQFERFRGVLRRDMGVDPSDELAALVRTLTRRH